jgi:hypothetical protein
MGGCDYCRNPDNDGKIQRKKRKMEFRRFILPEELASPIFHRFTNRYASTAAPPNATTGCSLMNAMI